MANPVKSKDTLTILCSPYDSQTHSNYISAFAILKSLSTADCIVPFCDLKNSGLVIEHNKICQTTTY